MRLLGWVLVIVLGLTHPVRVWPQQTSSLTSIEDRDKDLLSIARIAALADAARVPWTAYLLRSQQMHAADTATMNAELRATGRPAMTRAPPRAQSFDYFDRSDEWFRSDSAWLIADAMIAFQTPSGGWSKRTDMSHPRSSGMSYYSESESWQSTPTFEDGATTGQLRFLARLLATNSDPRYGTAYHRGIGYLLAAQEPNGCWPQSYPLEGGYHDAINDDATVLVLATLSEIVTGGVRSMSPSERGRSAASVRRGIACLLTTQVVVNGSPTIWGQQHDPISLEAIPPRRHELAGLASRESASILIFLMTLPNPDSSVVKAVHAAAAWFKGHAIIGTEPAAALTIYEKWARGH